MEIDAKIVIELYKKRISDLEHENILLQAQLIKTQQEVESKEIEK